MQTRDSLECLPPSARARAHVIPNPVSAPATAAPGDRPTVIAGVGRLIPQKGFDLLIRAFATVAGQFPQWNLVIWGEGDERTRLQALTDEHGLQGRISLPGLSRSEEHTSELQSLMRISYAVFCLKKKKTHNITTTKNHT